MVCKLCNLCGQMDLNDSNARFLITQKLYLSGRTIVKNAVNFDERFSGFTWINKETLQKKKYIILMVID